MMRLGARTPTWLDSSLPLRNDTCTVTRCFTPPDAHLPRSTLNSTRHDGTAAAGTARRLGAADFKCLNREGRSEIPSVMLVAVEAEPPKVEVLQGVDRRAVRVAADVGTGSAPPLRRAVDRRNLPFAAVRLHLERSQVRTAGDAPNDEHLQKCPHRQ